MAGDSRFQTLRAVLVEPSAVQAKIIRAECDEIGLHQVEHVATVAEALDTMLRRAPDLILSALYLPDGTGTELVEAMRGAAGACTLVRVDTQLFRTHEVPRVKAVLDTLEAF